MYAEERQQAIASLVIAQRPRLGHRAGAGLRRHHRDGPARPRRPGQGRACCGACTAARFRCARCTSSSPASASAKPPAPSTRTPSRRPPPSSSRSAAPACCWTPAPPPRASPLSCRPTASWSWSPTRCRSPPGWPAMPSVSLQLLGGRVRGVTQAAVGEQTLRVLDTLRVDIAFIGTNGDQRPPRPVHPGQRRGRRQAGHGRAPPIMSSWPPTPRKVGREDFVSFAPISSVDTLITDSEISDADRAQLDRARRRGGGRMIVTVTPNPSIDRTVTLATPLTRGAVHRVTVGRPPSPAARASTSRAR